MNLEEDWSIISSSSDLDDDSSISNSCELGSSQNDQSIATLRIPILKSSVSPGNYQETITGDEQSIKLSKLNMPSEVCMSDPVVTSPKNKSLVRQAISYYEDLTAEIQSNILKKFNNNDNSNNNNNNNRNDDDNDKYENYDNNININHNNNNDNNNNENNTISEDKEIAQSAIPISKGGTLISEKTSNTGNQFNRLKFLDYQVFKSWVFILIVLGGFLTLVQINGFWETNEVKPVKYEGTKYIQKDPSNGFNFWNKQPIQKHWYDSTQDMYSAVNEIWNNFYNDPPFSKGKTKNKNLPYNTLSFNFKAKLEKYSITSSELATKWINDSIFLGEIYFRKIDKYFLQATKSIGMQYQNLVNATKHNFEIVIVNSKVKWSQLNNDLASCFKIVSRNIFSGLYKLNGLLTKVSNIMKNLKFGTRIFTVFTQKIDSIANFFKFGRLGSNGFMVHINNTTPILKNQVKSAFYQSTKISKNILENLVKHTSRLNETKSKYFKTAVINARRINDYISSLNDGKSSIQN